MDLNTLKASLSDVIAGNKGKLELGTSLKTINWTLPTTIKDNLKLDELTLTGGKTGLTVLDAPSEAVKVEGSTVAAVMITGKPTGPDKILNIPIDKFTAITLFVSPAKPEQPDDQTANYTLVLEFDKQWDATSEWTPGDSFPPLAKRMGFSALRATANPSFLLSSFEHAQAWNYAGATPQNTLPEVAPGLNLQLPSGYLLPYSLSFLTYLETSPPLIFPLTAQLTTPNSPPKIRMT